ncbi:MAG: hypothetical protein ACF8K1_00025 [Phycisphaerales bacterium JB047]
MIGRVTDTLGALWVLLTLGFATKFRFNGEYWDWRTKTALDAQGAPEGKIARMHLAMEYARWAWRMRRLR